MSAPAKPNNSKLRVARLIKPHGLKGALKLELYTDFPEERFKAGTTFLLQVPESSPWFGKTLTARELRWYNGQPVGFFDEVSDRASAESISKAILWVDSESQISDESDAWYIGELVGLPVFSGGVQIGEVLRVDHFPGQDKLIVKHVGREVIVPFVSAIVPVVDTVSRRIELTPPDGLFEELDGSIVED